MDDGCRIDCLTALGVLVALIAALVAGVVVWL